MTNDITNKQNEIKKIKKPIFGKNNLDNKSIYIMIQ